MISQYSLYRAVTNVFLVGITMLLFNGCIQKSIPRDDVGFQTITNIKQLDGCYVNLAESGNTYKLFLSQVLWRDQNLSHEKIKYICVEMINKQNIKVSAMDKNNKVMFIREYVKNNDFILKSGKIIIKDNLNVVNDNFAGIGSISMVLGIDTKGNGRYVKSETFAGIALLIPMVAHQSLTYRFVRINK